MQKQITTERAYTVNFHKPGAKDSYGISVTVTGDSKTKVMKEAKAMFKEAQQTAIETYSQFMGKGDADNENTDGI